MFDEQSSTDKEQERIKNVMKQIEEFVAQGRHSTLLTHTMHEKRLIISEFRSG